MSDPEAVEELKIRDPFDAVAEAKLLLRTIRAGALATLTQNSGDPFASLVTIATEPDGSPILLLSQLAAHTRQLSADARLSLLLAQTGEGDPLAHPRLTLTGRAEQITDRDRRMALRTRFLARHPKAELYADFGDFSFWHVDMERASMNGGFARAASFPASRLRTSLEGAEALVSGEADALAHMNADHAEAIALYATVLAGKPAGAWRATGLDPEGIDLASEDLTARVAFPDRVCDLAGLRSVLVDLAKRARAV